MNFLEVGDDSDKHYGIIGVLLELKQREIQ